MINNSPKITVAMSVYNAEKTIRASLLSIMNQTFLDWELVIIDDGSRDNSIKIIREFSDPRIKFFSDGKNKGLACRLNQAIFLSKGKYFSRMDADDVAYPKRLSIQFDYMENNSDIDLLGSKVMVFNENYDCVGGFPFREGHQDICRKPWSGFHLPHPTWFGKTEWFKRNLYKESSKKSEDQELLLRSYGASKFFCLNEILLGYRQDKLSVKKETLTRLSKLKDFFIIYTSKRNYILALYSSVLQIMKWVFSVASILTPFTLMLLKHRAVAVSDEECKKWKIICRSVGLNNDF